MAIKLSVRRPPRPSARLRVQPLKLGNHLRRDTANSLPLLDQARDGNIIHLIECPLIGEWQKRVTATHPTSCFSDNLNAVRHSMTKNSQGQLRRRVKTYRPSGGMDGIYSHARNTGCILAKTKYRKNITLVFASGLTQAGLLIMLSELAVSAAQGKHGIQIKGADLSTDFAILASALLLVLYFISSMIAALASSSMASSALEAGRSKIINAFFGASWSVQSEERLGHVQQLLTVNCDNIGNVVFTMSGGLQSLLSVVALLVAAFVVNPITAGIVLVFGVVLVLVATLQQLVSKGVCPAFTR